MAVGTENLPSLFLGWFIVIIVTALCSGVVGAICSHIKKELIPIGYLIGGVFGFILGLIIKTMIQLP